MNILYIHTNELRDKEIYEALKQTGNTVYETVAPTPFDSYEDYAAQLLKSMEEGNVDVCFCLDYFPIVSIGCEAMKKVYIAYTQHPYNPALYSLTTGNRCNLIFVPDYSAYENFVAAGRDNIFFLPLGVARESIATHVTEADSEDGPDLTITEPVKKRSEIELNLVGTESPLKDATKGYLEGCIACRHQIRGLPSMYHYLPIYIREEIMRLMPPVLEPMSAETPETYFDNRSFNEFVTVADRDIHFAAIMKNEYFKKISVYAEEFENDDEKISVMPPLERGPEFSSAVRKSKINLLIPHRNWVSGISGRTWDVLAAGGFVMEPLMTDIVGLFETPMNHLFTNEFTMMSSSINRLNHADERVETINSVLDELKDKHTYDKRLSTIFDYLE